jgi:dipeptidyl aminopeptidase/acylaminoacyl peptidase
LRKDISILAPYVRPERAEIANLKRSPLVTVVRTSPCGSWSSPLTSDLIVAETIGLADVLLDGDDIYWIEGRPREAGRNVLVRQVTQGKPLDVTPAPFNVRTRVHEYGGGAATVSDGVVYFSHFADQRLHRQEPGSAPVPLTPEGRWRYADGLIDRSRQRWIGVREDHTVAGREAVNTLVDIDLGRGGPGRVLVSGHDFYASPRLSPDGRCLAWLAWRHPHMPWVSTELWVADCGDDGQLRQAIRVAGSDSESIFQPEWSRDGSLFFVSDRSGWWNLYRHAGGRSEPLCPMPAEFGQAMWTLGLSTYAVVSPDRLLCSYVEKGLGKLAWLDPTRRRLTPLDLPYQDFAFVRAGAGHAVFRAGSPTEPVSVVRLELDSGRLQVLRRATNVADRPVEDQGSTPSGTIRSFLSEPRPVEFPTENGLTAHGLYYAPHNPRYQAPAGERPPLVVKCHGGPTSASSSNLDLRIQFWTSRGIAVLEVNYGGSTGYGRDYRHRLHRQWGIVDVDDCINGAKYLAAQGWVDEKRAVISGGSAGGYTTLAALTFRDYFQGGGSHYGVSDTEALTRDTHKFESRYLEWLIAPYPEGRDVFHQRSPIHHLELLTAASRRTHPAIIFFQGDEDLVVPPDQTERMVAALRQRNLPVGYLLFTGEQHGFRKGGNIQRALDAELYFYSVQVFGTGLTF